MIAAAEQMAATYFADGTLPELPYGNLIDGAFRVSARGETMESFDPGLGRPFASFAVAGPDEVAEAVAAAQRGLAVWRRSSPAERRKVLNAVAVLMRERAELLALLEAHDSGKTLAEARGDIANSTRLFEYYAGVADTLEGASIPLASDHMSWTLREPALQRYRTRLTSSSRTRPIAPRNYSLPIWIRQ